MTDEGDPQQFRDRVDDALEATPAYLLFPVAARTVMVTPDDLAQPGQARCTSRGRLVGSISNGAAMVPVQRDLRCGRRPDHLGTHLLFISPAAGAELSWFYEWNDESE
jgi:hypothetical protein